MRKPMVTRTIQTTTAQVVYVDINNEITDTMEVTVPRTYKDEKTLMKAISAVVDGDGIKAVHVKSTTVNETLYAMSEADFIAHAHPISKNSNDAE